MIGKKYKIISIFIVLLVCIITMVMITYAFFTSKDDVINTINIGDVDIEVSEEFKPPENWDGAQYPKLVKILNKSKSPALIRVALTIRWVDNTGNSWPGDTNIVSLNYANKNIISPPATTPTDKWVDGNDGYYYYNTVVPKNSTTVDLLESVSANIPNELKDRYKDKTLIVDVKAEAVQATNDAHRKAWSSIADLSDIQRMLDSLCAR